MGRSRNKVAVPEGAAGTPPFWRPDEATLGNKKSWDLDKPWLARYQFYLFEILKRKLQATSYKLRESE